MCSDKSKKNWQQFRDDIETDESVQPEDNDLNDIDEEEDTDEERMADPALSHPSYLELEEKLTEAEQKAQENWEKSVRALSELDNVRRRAEKDVEKAHRYGLKKLIDSMLPVVDSLEQALQLAEQENNQAMHEGLELTMKLFLDVLAKHGVGQIDPIGAAFDPQLHEAMSMQETSDAAPNTVLTVFQKGYKLNDRVVRPARVIVAKG